MFLVASKTSAENVVVTQFLRAIDNIDHHLHLWP